jgi:UDP-glucose 4-epimerase
MTIFISGALGFIGSHTVVEFKDADQIILVDDLSNSKIQVLDRLNKLTSVPMTFYEVDVTDMNALKPIFEKHQIDAVIHFAGYKAVGESVEKPLMYYKNNLLATINLAECCINHGVEKFIFSSSATVYGDQPSPLVETMDLKPTTNPYGETKAMSERILKDVARAHPNFSVTLLRYFNPIGAHESGLIGEDPNGIPNNLMPFITKVAKGTLKELSVYGSDYDTYDGTGVRDYIHVVDLAKGHVQAYLKMKKGVNIYNLGTGKGISVLEILETFKRVNKIDVPYKIVDRRPGDVATVYADARNALVELNWKTEKTVEDMVRDAWRFEKNHQSS